MRNEARARELIQRDTTCIVFHLRAIQIKGRLPIAIWFSTVFCPMSAHHRVKEIQMATDYHL